MSDTLSSRALRAAVLSALAFLAACGSTRTTYAERLNSVADAYEADLARVERLRAGAVRPRSSYSEQQLVSAIERSASALAPARSESDLARREESRERMQRAAAFSNEAREAAYEANSYYWLPPEPTQGRG